MVHNLKLLMFPCLIFLFLGFVEVCQIVAASPDNTTGETPLFAEVGWLWGPSNFEECISENVKGVSSRIATKAIILACFQLFPNSENSTPVSSSDKEIYKCFLKELKGAGNDLAAKLAIVNCWQRYQGK